jgi:hypothetical protein
LLEENQKFNANAKNSLNIVKKQILFKDREVFCPLKESLNFLSSY